MHDAPNIFAAPANRWSDRTAATQGPPAQPARQRAGWLAAAAVFIAWGALAAVAAAIWLLAD
ncbi:MAG: hypothetical protein R3F55_23615 [Alphaproteobacteria bacterium]